MGEVNVKRLLKSRLVQDEIARHRWIESEKAGHDIGYERAAEDWINRFAEIWIQHNVPSASKKKKG